MMDLPRRGEMLAGTCGGLSFHRGVPLPLGVTVGRGGINFSVFTRHATTVTLGLFQPGEALPVVEFPLDPRLNRTGDVWHAYVEGLDPGFEYAWRMDRVPNEVPHLNRYDPTAWLLDPRARDITGGRAWNDPAQRLAGRRNTRRSLLPAGEFDWQDDPPLAVPLADSVLYELHVRGFTRHPSSRVRNPGTFAGLVERIPYLKSLGVTAVELLPVTEFDETATDHCDPVTGEPLVDFRGYNPISFFAPKESYAAATDVGGEIREFKEMVRTFHAAGIEVILDVVFNHTAEGDERGRTQSFRGIDNRTYYLLDPATGRYLNYSGCGNTLNCNHPVVRDLVLDALRYWVTEMHVDGFRFDLASILGRGRNGEVLSNPPLLERIAEEPVLAHTKLIAEAWDAGGLYQVGSFPSWGRWAEWNGRFRDDVRRFVRGDEGMVPSLATRLLGSPDLYARDARAPYHGINFVTCHDGFTLADLVAYDRKHNERNGEENRDGLDDNASWNCGVEGPSDDPLVQGLRARQQRNLAALLLLSQGVPMLLAGDEFGRSQQGNNNAFCQDNETSWVDWRLAEPHADLLRFFRLLIGFRRGNPLVRRPGFYAVGAAEGPRAAFHGVRLGEPDLSPGSRSIALHLCDPGVAEGARDLYLVASSYWEPLLFELPAPSSGRWHRLLDTSYVPPDEIAEPGREVPLGPTSHYLVGPRSVVVLVGR